MPRSENPGLTAVCPTVDLGESQFVDLADGLVELNGFGPHLVGPVFNIFKYLFVF